MKEVCSPSNREMTSPLQSWAQILPEPALPRLPAAQRLDLAFRSQRRNQHRYRLSECIRQ